MDLLTQLMANPEVSAMFNCQQLVLQHSLPLGCYLLKPVQRILKYQLLLQVLLFFFLGARSFFADVFVQWLIDVRYYIHLPEPPLRRQFSQTFVDSAVLSENSLHGAGRQSYRNVA